MAHYHDVIDNDPVILIDSESRVITNHTPKKIINQGDHASEIITFQMDREIDGHDMTLCNQVEIHYLNGSGADRVKGIYIVEDLAIDPNDPNKITFTWVLHNKATSVVGPLDFTVKFGCVNNGLLEYSWSTAICSHLSIQPTIDNSDYPDSGDYDEVASYESLKTELLETQNEIKKIQNEINDFDIDTKLSEKQNIMSPIVVPTEDVSDTMAWIYPDGKTMFYSIEFKYDEWTPECALLISADDLPEDTEYTFYVYVKIGEAGLSFPPSLYVEIGSAETLTWIEEPTIEYPCTKMLLAFQTTDGGRSWIANQCYSLEVTE